MIQYFKYPVVNFESDDPEDTEISYHKGRIRYIRLDQEPYEISLDAQGCSFHLIFGSQINGNFLCIPNWQFGCELADYSEKTWNLNSILHEYSKLDYEDATAIVWALSLISKYIEEQSRRPEVINNSSVRS